MKTQKVEPLVEVNDLRLLGRKSQTDIFEHIRNFISQFNGVGTFALDHDYKVVRIADKPVGRQAFDSASASGTTVAHRLPCLGEMLVKRM